MSKKTIISILSIILVFFVSYFAVLFVGFAQEAETSEEEDEFSIWFCDAQVIPFVQEEGQKLQEWLENHFRNNADNTELLGDAIDRYRQFEDKIFRKLDEVYGGEPGDLFGPKLLGYDECLTDLREAISDFKKTFKMFVSSNSTVKKTTKLSNKYKSINKKLRKLNINVGFFRGYFNTLKSKVVCYVKECLR